MKQLNRYYRRAKISERKTRQIIKYFALDLTAQKTALLTNLTRKSVNQIYLKIRNRLAEEAERASPFSSCKIEVDESYFGARRVRGESKKKRFSRTFDTAGEFSLDSFVPSLPLQIKVVEFSPPELPVTSC